MELTIRALLPADAEAFRDVRCRAVADHPEAYLVSLEEEEARSVDWIRDNLTKKTQRDDDWIFGAFDGDRLIGITGAVRTMPEHAKGRHHATIWGVYVAPGARGQRVGEGLMRAAIDALAAAPGITRIQLGVGVENTHARDLYARLGFETYGIEKRSILLDGRYIDEELMALYL